MMLNALQHDRGTVLVAGASGVIGQASVACFSEAGWSVLGVSRRRPDLDHPFTHLSLDLTDSSACASALSERNDITHLVFAALYEKDDLVAGWRDPEQMAVNLAMLRNTLDPLLASGSLRHVSLLQGTKAYGVHIRPFDVPAKESWPRHQHENFYWLQEDYLKGQAAKHGFDTTIFRPQVVFGGATGVAMNLVPVIGAYAALRSSEGLPCSFPGGPSYLLEAIDADLLAKALHWAAEADAARGETFNITNGDVFAWHTVWPALADALRVEVGEPEPQSMTSYLPCRAAAWEEIATMHGLREPNLQALVGQSHHYADFCFAYGAQRPPAPALVSTIKLRQAGFHDCIDTEAMFRKHIATLQRQRILPSA